MINRAFRLVPAGAVRPGELILTDKGRVQVETITISSEGVGLVGPGIDRAKGSRTKHVAQPSEKVTVVAPDATIDAVELAVLDGKYEVVGGEITVSIEENDGARANVWLVTLRDNVAKSLADG